MSGPRLAGKVALVTGGASGIGLAAVERFTEEGACVVFCDLSPDQSVHRTQRPDGFAIAERIGVDRCAFVPADVTDRAQLAAVVDTAIERFGGLDVLYNNAGISGAEGPIVDCSEELFDRTLAVDLKAVWLGIKLAAPHIAARGGGAIVSTASVAGLLGHPNQGAYGSAKAGVIQLTRVAAMELASMRIRVNCVCPGGIVTPIIYDSRAMPTSLDPDKLRAALQAAQPFPKAGEAVDIANAALWLASDEAAFVTGQAIAVDGGLSAEFPGSRRRR